MRKDVPTIVLGVVNAFNARDIVNAGRSRCGRVRGRGRGCRESRFLWRRTVARSRSRSIELGQPRFSGGGGGVVWCGAVDAVLRRGLQGAHRQGLGPWAFKSCRRAADKNTNDPQA
jgi:hypothetical protein